ncbi:MAG: hypothetical protein HKN11_19835 [Rhizobiales bacterium]|nr:hypothetical protein [Hyphomicrobiales bacterium]
MVDQQYTTTQLTPPQLDSKLGVDFLDETIDAAAQNQRKPGKSKSFITVRTASPVISTTNQTGSAIVDDIVAWFQSESSVEVHYICNCQGF